MIPERNSNFIVSFVLCIFLLAFNCQSLMGQTEPLSTPEIHENTAPALVLIKTDTGAGSGFLIDQSGLIATALHVVEEAEAVQVSTSAGDIFDTVQLVAQDQRRDLAILKVAGFDLPFVRLGNSNELSPGDRLVIVGNPLGVDVLGGSVTEGIVSGIRDLGGGFRTIQTDSAISPGHSGSPVLDSVGDTVGIVSFRIVGGESLNFAIPINYLRGLQGMQGSNPLTVWSTPLGETDIAVPSSDASSRDQVSGIFRAVETGFIYSVRQQSERIYAFAQGIGNDSLAFDVVLSPTEEDLYIGKMNLKSTCSCFTCVDGAIYFAEEMAEIRVVDNSRLEVRWQLPAEGLPDAIDCRGSRLKDGPRAWIRTQAWIREP